MKRNGIDYITLLSLAPCKQSLFCIGRMLLRAIRTYFYLFILCVGGRGGGFLRQIRTWSLSSGRADKSILTTTTTTPPPLSSLTHYAVLYVKCCLSDCVVECACVHVSRTVERRGRTQLECTLDSGVSLSVLWNVLFSLFCPHDTNLRT